MSLRVVAKPPSARLFLDEAPLGANPIEGRFVRDGASHVVRAEAPGYRSKSQVVVFGAERVNVELALVPEPIVHRPPAAPAPRPPAAAPPRPRPRPHAPRSTERCARPRRPPPARSIPRTRGSEDGVTGGTALARGRTMLEARSGERRRDTVRRLSMRAILLFLFTAFMAACGARQPRTAAETRHAFHDDHAQHGLPGSRLRMRLPEGFVRPNRLPLVLHPKLDIKISIAELTIPAMQENDLAELLASGEQTGPWSPDTRHTAIERRGAKGILLDGSQNDLHTMVLTMVHGRAYGQVVCSFAPKGERVARTVLDSVWLDSEAPLDAARLNGLVIGSAEKLEPSDVMSTGVLLKDPSVSPPIPVTSPTLNVIPVNVSSEDELKSSLDEVLRIGGVDKSTLTHHDAELDGSPAAELLADAQDEGVRVRFWGMLLVKENGGGIFMYGTFLPTHDEYLARFRTVARSTHLVDVTGPVHLP